MKCKLVTTTTRVNLLSEMKIHSFLIFIFILTFASCSTKEIEIPEGFQINPKFNLELVASEPLIFDPVEMKFDEKGDAYVMEMPGYPMSDVDSRLILLKDENGDGIFDKRIVFADDLGVSTSFTPYKEGFLVASPPQLLWLKDTNNDGVADERKIIMSGFGSSNLQHNFNGLTYGLDNWIYISNGGNSSSPYFETKPEKGFSLRRGDLRLDIENEEMVRVGSSSGGYKITFDEWGHLFENHNMEHSSHLVFEDRYTENLPGSPSNALQNISDHEENGTSRIYPIGAQDTRVNHPEQSGYFSGACGITFYGGGSFPSDFGASILVADCVLNLVHLDILSKNESSFKTSRKREGVEFLASKDRSFRPVNMTHGPDGALYVIDIHREVIEHPEWIPDELEKDMDLNAGKEKGRIYRVTPKKNWTSESKKLSIENVESLVLSLTGKTQWERSTAQRLIVTNKLKTAIPYLVELYETSENPLARIHSMWTLEGLNEFSNLQLKKALKDESVHIRENALKIVEKRIGSNNSFIQEVLTLTKDKDARVRMQATLTLSTLNEVDFQNNSLKIKIALKHQLSHFENDIWSVRAIASASKRQALNFIETLLKDNLTNNASLEVIQILTQFIGKNNQPQETITLLKYILNINIEKNNTLSIIQSLSEGWSRNTSKFNSKEKNHVQIELEKIEKQGNISLIRAAGDLRQVLGLSSSSKIKPLLKNAYTVVLDQNSTTEKRLENLEFISLDNFENRANLLYLLINNKMPIALQKEAMAQLRNSNNKTIAPKLLELWGTLGSETRRTATNILLYKSYNHPILLTAMENNRVSLGEFNLDLERRRVLLFSRDSDIKKRAELLFSDAGVVKRKEVIEKMKPSLLLDGNISNGKTIFTRVCANCHIFGTIGIEVGPSLTEISRKSKEALLHDILDPNAGVDTEYLNHKLIAKDGSIYMGLVHKETDEEITIKMMGGTTETIKKEDIESLTSTGASLMFEGLENSMSIQEMADLLAFLQLAN